jgi:hypothetical protein
MSSLRTPMSLQRSYKERHFKPITKIMYILKEHPRISTRRYFDCIITNENHFKISVPCCRTFVTIPLNLFDQEKENEEDFIEKNNTWKFYHSCADRKTSVEITKEEFLSCLSTFRKVLLTIRGFGFDGGQEERRDVRIAFHDQKNNIWYAAEMKNTTLSFHSFIIEEEMAID